MVEYLRISVGKSTKDIYIYVILLHISFLRGHVSISPYYISLTSTKHNFFCFLSYDDVHDPRTSVRLSSVHTLILCILCARAHTVSSDISYFQIVYKALFSITLRYLRTKRKFIIRRQQRRSIVPEVSPSVAFLLEGCETTLAPSTLREDEEDSFSGDGVDLAKALVLSISRIEDGRRGERRAE